MAAQRDSTGVLVWLGGAVFAGVAVSGLLLGPSRPPLQQPQRPAPPAAADGAPHASGSALAVTAALPVDAAGGSKDPVQPAQSALDSPLRMAELAVQAGMLLEPEGYSAWSLYQRALRDDPDDRAARDGLHAVAELLVKRAAVAMEQARIADARRLLATVREVLPEYMEAERLATALELLNEHQAGAVQAAASERTPARPVQVAPPPAARPAPAHAPRLSRQGERRPTTGPAKAAPAPPDPLAEAAAAFAAALAREQLLTPEGASARHYLLQLADLDADEPRTLAARGALTQRLLARAAEAIEAVDTVGAEVWLREAESLGADAALIATARQRLDTKLIALAAASPIPVSELTVLSYVPPRYPPRAIERELEGWVELEFTVDTGGQPRSIKVLEASHERYFRKEAVNALRQWEFEPRVVRGEVVAQRAFARIAFKLQE